MHRDQSQGHAHVGGSRLGLGLVRLGGFLEGDGARFVLAERGEGSLCEPSAVHVIQVVLELVLPLEGGGAVGAAEGPGV